MLRPSWKRFERTSVSPAGAKTSGVVVGSKPQCCSIATARMTRIRTSVSTIGSTSVEGTVITSRPPGLSRRAQSPARRSCSPGGMCSSRASIVITSNGSRLGRSSGNQPSTSRQLGPLTSRSSPESIPTPSPIRRSKRRNIAPSAEPTSSTRAPGFTYGAAFAMPPDAEAGGRTVSSAGRRAVARSPPPRSRLTPVGCDDPAADQRSQDAEAVDGGQLLALLAAARPCRRSGPRRSRTPRSSSRAAISGSIAKPFSRSAQRRERGRSPSPCGRS